MSETPGGKPLIMTTVAGSWLYGLNTPESDVDYQGAFLADAEDFWEIGGVPTAYQTEHDVADDIDYTYHELQKFMGLLQKSNPHALDVVWSPVLIKYLSFPADLIVGAREQLLSRRIVDTHLGYAKHTVRSAHENGVRVEKSQRHAARLLLNTENALLTGEYRPRLTADEVVYCRSLEKHDPVRFADWFDAEHHRVQHLPTDLPAEPDRDIANDVVITIRRWQLGLDTGSLV